MSTTEHELQANLEIKPIQGLTVSRYINVFTDEDGETKYSNDDFAVGEDGIYSLDDAINDAYILTVRGTQHAFTKGKTKWTYLCTLSNAGRDVTEEVSKELARLDDVLTDLKNYGVDYWHLQSYELDDALEYAKEDSGQFGVGA